MPKPLFKAGGSSAQPFAKVMAFYGKPLVDEKRLPLFDEESIAADVQKALHMLNRSILRRVRAEIQKLAYSAEARKILAAAIKIEIKSSSLIVSVNHPSFKPLIMGQKKQQMTWLLKSKAPIPIVTERGEIIFRTATARSMAGGGWVHPGRPSTGIIEKVKVEARESIKKRIAADIRRRLREMAA
jgi:hypothetical protein